jgi:hypothetical protein
MRIPYAIIGFDEYSREYLLTIGDGTSRYVEARSATFKVAERKDDSIVSGDFVSQCKQALQIAYRQGILVPSDANIFRRDFIHPSETACEEIGALVNDIIQKKQLGEPS